MLLQYYSHYCCQPAGNRRKITELISAPIGLQSGTLFSDSCKPAKLLNVSRCQRKTALFYVYPTKNNSHSSLREAPSIRILLTTRNSLRFREERSDLLMLYDTSHTKRDYKFWICHPWYTVDIAVTWLKYINLSKESTHLVIVCYQGLHSRVKEDMIWNWWNDVATHSWEQTFSPSELSTCGTDFQVTWYLHPQWMPLKVNWTITGRISVTRWIQKTSYDDTQVNSQKVLVA